MGGMSPEHEVSLLSAKNVYEAADKKKYDICLIAIDKTGRWQLLNKKNYLVNATDPNNIRLNPSGNEIAITPHNPNGQFMNMATGKFLPKIDVVFPVMHGTYAEDGTIQGLLKIAGIPFVGAGVLGSAAGMDKEVMKRLLRDAGIPIGKYYAIEKHNYRKADIDKIIKNLKFPIFVKPANMGSSVGVRKSDNKNELLKNISYAFRFDNKILLEQCIVGREIECAVLGNENPEASAVAGEVITKAEHGFYSYEAKYLDPAGARLLIPTKISAKILKKVQDISVATFKTLYCEGLGRVDCFLTSDGKVYINEINTLPGFTSISMYPKLWQLSGISYPVLIDKLIQLAISRYKKESALQTNND